MAKQNIHKELSYIEYLNSLNKSDVTSVLDIFHISYKKNQKKQIYIDLIINNLNQIVDHTLNLFQIDELHNMKLLIKKKGKITIRINHLLLAFLKTLEKNKLVIEISPKTYVMPKELLNVFKKKLKNKGPVEKAKSNTKEYSLILGLIDVYGVIEFNHFYDLYAKDYKLTKEKAMERIKALADFYNEFKIYEDKKRTCLTSTVVKSQRTCNYLMNIKKDYAIYTNEELISIHNFTFMNQYKSYKKLMKFIKRNYYVEKSNYKIINNYVLIPFLTNYQLNKEEGIKVLSDLIDTHFEFNNQKHKNKFIDLFEKMALDYPSWELKGHSPRGKKC